jgi:PDZ domain
MKRHSVLIIVLATLLVANAWDGSAAAEPVVLASSAEAKPQPLGEAEIAALVRQLDSNRYQEREQATQSLLAAGDAALDPLVAAANSDRPEAADRAVWLLRKFGNSTDRVFALAALDRLVQLKDRPAVVAEARQIQTRLQLAICEEQLAKLGGKLTMVDRPQVDGSIVSTVRVELGDDWHGTLDDLKCLLGLDQQNAFCLVGSAVTDDVIKIFEAKDNLRLMQIFLSRVTPAAVDSLKEHQPKVTVYIRNRALLGIGGESQANGVRVTQAQDGFGAAKAGIVLGDVVTEIDGKPLKDFDRLTAIISQHQPGDVVDVTILRGGEQLTKQVTLSDKPPEDY